MFWAVQQRLAAVRGARAGTRAAHRHGAGIDANDPDAQNRTSAFLQAMQQLGWIDGRNLRVDYFWGQGQPAVMRKHAAELAALAPDAILVSGTAALGHFAGDARGADRVRECRRPGRRRLRRELSRPGGNATGFIQFEYSLAGKWLELLKQIAPDVTRAAVLRDAALSSGIGQFAVIQSVAPSVGVEVGPINVRDAGEIERAVAAFARTKSRPGGDVKRTVGAPPRAHHRAGGPAQAAGRLLSTDLRRRRRADLLWYDLIDQYRRAAGYVDRILKGEKPADLPVQAPTKYEITSISRPPRRSASTCRPRVLARADEVIE